MTIEEANEGLYLTIDNHDLEAAKLFIKAGARDHNRGKKFLEMAIRQETEAPERRCEYVKFILETKAYEDLELTFALVIAHKHQRRDISNLLIKNLSTPQLQKVQAAVRLKVPRHAIEKEISQRINKKVQIVKQAEPGLEI